jgi:hypothetical protein
MLRIESWRGWIVSVSVTVERGGLDAESVIGSKG